MPDFVWIALLAAGSLKTAILLKTFSATSAGELKRRARSGDTSAARLYKAAAHGANLSLFLWILAGLLNAALFVVLANSLSTVASVAAITAVLLVSFGWILRTRASSMDIFLASTAAPALGWLLAKLRPALLPASRFISKRYRATDKAAIYEKEDLVGLLVRQKKLAHNRISKEEIGIAIGSLKFGDKQVSDILIPRRAVKTISANDSIGPVLLDELHKSGHSRFPVYDGKKDNLVGMLYMHDLVEARSGGLVKDFMKKKLYYVKEDQPLAHVLDAFIKTKHHLFIVVNNFEEMVGIISMEDVLEQILGRPILDEFDRYEDMRAVAAIGAEKDAEERKESQEVVE